MRKSKIVSIITILILLFSVFLVFNVSSDESMENDISAHFDITFETATSIKMKVSMDVKKITLQGAKKISYTSSEIATIAENELITLGTIIQQLNIDLSEQITQIFQDAAIDSPYDSPYYEEELFKNEYTINLTANFFGMNESVDLYNFVNGVIHMGAIANYSLDFNANEGWYNTYDVSLGNPLLRHSTNGEEISNIMQWKLDNRNGMHPTALAKIQIKHDNYDQLRLKSEDISLEFELDTRQIEKTGLNVNIISKNIDIRDYDILPDFISSLDFVPSDGIRLFVNNNLLESWDEFYDKTIEKIKDKVIPIIENSPSFNQTLSTISSWDENTTDLPGYTITDMNNETPIKAILTDEDISLKICNISPRALFGLLNVGASVNISQDDVNFGLGLADITYPYKGVLYLPESLSLDENNVYRWNKSEGILGNFDSEVSEIYSDDEINTVVEIEITNADLNLLGIFTGKTELTLSMFLQETQNYYVTEMPNEFNLPKKVVLDYISSDAFRLCIEESIFDDKSIVAFLNHKKILFETRSRDIFPSDDLELSGHEDRDTFDESVDNWDGDITNMNIDSPVKVASYARCSYPASCTFSMVPPKFNVNTINLSFSGIQKQSVTYKIIFPKGITIDAEDETGRSTTKQQEDGRHYLEVSFNSSEAGLKDVVNCKMTLSSMFILSIFMPCILSFIVTVILIAVVYMLRKKRKGRKPVVIKEDDFEGYDREDYYIPPPPSSKK